VVVVVAVQAVQAETETKFQVVVQLEGMVELQALHQLAEQLFITLVVVGEVRKQERPV
jgi:hypothetical protein